MRRVSCGEKWSPGANDGHSGGGCFPVAKYTYTWFKRQRINFGLDFSARQQAGFDFVKRIAYFEHSQSSLLMCLFFGRSSRMAQHESAEKRARQAKRRAARNAQWKSRMRNAVKRVRATTDKEKAKAELNKTVKLLDQLAAKGVIHKNMASNQKSRLTRLVNSLK